ncbi:MAG: hypothetical protein K0S86_1306 [Geminicoccaceae bacterium]|jgi:hypothetical protein|nr:hypothetical protein [Geminicoccaceae bacterium]
MMSSRFNIGRLAALAAVALAVPATVPAQGPVARATLDPAVDSVIAPIVAQAVAVGLPADLLYAKAREGQVRRVPVSRIEATVRTLAQRLRVAHDALAPNPTAQELRAATDALAHNVPEEVLRDMRKAGGDGSLAVPLGVLTSLIARGATVEQATVRVVELLQRGAVPKNFIALEERVREDVLAGRRPDESLDLRMKGIIPNLPQSATSAATADGLQSTGGPRRAP